METRFNADKRIKLVVNIESLVITIKCAYSIQLNSDQTRAVREPGGNCLHYRRFMYFMHSELLEVSLFEMLQKVPIESTADRLDLVQCCSIVVEWNVQFNHIFTFVAKLFDKNAVKQWLVIRYNTAWQYCIQ